MPRTNTIIHVFVSGPSDIADERDQLQAVVGDINDSLGESTGIRIILLDADRHAPANIGEYPQDVINTAIPDYDIFLGVLKHRLGTPTPEAPSGTVEEYDRALTRYRENQASIDIIFYFHTGPLPNPETLDIQQFQAVRDFRARVSRDGVYYKTYNTLDEFTRRVNKRFITIGINAWKSTLHTNDDSDSEGESTGVEMNTTPDSEPEHGLLDLNDMFEMEVAGLISVLENMTNIMAEVAQNVKTQTPALNAITVAGKKTTDAAEQKRLRDKGRPILDNIATELDEFGTRLTNELTPYRRHLDMAISIFTQMAPLYPDLGEDATEELVTSVSSMLDQMDTSVEVFESMKASVEIPRLTAPLIQARRNAQQSIQELIDITRGARAAFGAAVTLIPSQEDE